MNGCRSPGHKTYDVDRDTARFDWDDLSCAPPNIVALSRQTGHAHYLYGIDPAVHAYSGANAAPLRYLGSIDVAMTEELGADRGYSKLLAKNPLHNRWDVLTPPGLSSTTSMSSRRGSTSSSTATNADGSRRLDTGETARFSSEPGSRPTV